MTRIVEVSVPSRLAAVLPDGAHLAFEPQIPYRDEDSAYVWSQDHDPVGVLETLEADEEITRLDIVEHYPGRVLARIEWDRDPWEFHRCIREFGGAILMNRYRDGRWEARIRFPGQEPLREFHQHCRSNGIRLQVDRLMDSSRTSSPGAHGLTEKQQEALALARDGGYFAIPRQTATEDLAAELGISDQAFIERLRRGILALMDGNVPADQS